MEDYLVIIEKANNAKKSLSLASSEMKIKALEAISKGLIENIDLILKANKIDLENAFNISDVMKKRLLLTEDKIKAIASDVLAVSKLDDPVNQVIEEINRPNGLLIKQVRVPFGVILAIFESRPNVVVDIASLCIKTGNVCVLRGGKEAMNTNKVLVDIIGKAIERYIDKDSVLLITDTNRELVDKLILLKDKIDLVVPRGGKGLIDKVVNNSLVPVIETGAGVCHAYIDEDVDLDMAVNIVRNGKMSNPAVCNSLECLLVNKKVAKEFFDKLLATDFKDNVQIYGCDETNKYIDCVSVESYHEEFDDLKINVKIVNNVDEAIDHIGEYSTKHSEVIISNNLENQEKFLDKVDSACVYVNSSTRFTDGGCFGFGAELGISTGKMHARGPMGLKEMTTYKYKIIGNGQVR